MATSQLLILGNGFDLHCGLKSGYKDFFHGAILDTIGRQFGLQQMKTGVSGFWEGLLLEYYALYGDQDFSWCDIENIIKVTLMRVIFGDDTSICIWANAYNSVISRRRLIDEIKNFRDPIVSYLYQCCFNLFHAHMRELYSNDKGEIIKLLTAYLLQELHSFEKRFCKYIRDNIINPQNDKELNEKYIVNAMNLLAKLTDFTNLRFEDIEDIIDSQEEECWEQTDSNMRRSARREKHILSQEFSNLQSTHILSFNYTSLFDILGVESPCAYSNVHGKLCMKKCDAGCEASNIIFGIDDSVIQSKAENAELHIFSKTYRKMLHRGSPTSILPSKDNPVEIKFYGHSLSAADYSYFQSVFDYYNLYGNDRVSLTFYYSKGFEQTDKIYQLVNTYGATLSNREQGKNLIHKLLLENRLKIIEID